MTKEKDYLEYAKKHAQIVDGLIEVDNKYDLVAGNAGAVLVLIRLYEVTGEKRYLQTAERAFQRILKNVTIMEKGIAWCHGAAGVLLSRLYCHQMVREQKWRTQMQIDIERARDKVKKYWKRDSWCLCHGSFGNQWILELAGVTDVYNKNEEVTLLPQEVLHPGLMSGYGGILYYLIKEQEIGLPNLLILEV